MCRALRLVILRMSCAYELTECLQESTSQYELWKQDIDNNP